MNPDECVWVRGITSFNEVVAIPDNKVNPMTPLQFSSVCGVALGLLTFTTGAGAQDKPDADLAKVLISRLTEVREPDIGYSASVSGSAFFPLGRREPDVMLFGQRAHAESSTMLSLVKLGAKAIPALLDHLADDRPTRIVIEYAGIAGGLFVEQDDGEKGTSIFGEGFVVRDRHTVLVGDLCYVALGQILNRYYTAVYYQPTALVFATCVPKCKKRREELKREWQGFTAERHRHSLAKDLDSDEADVRSGASLRLGYYYPAAFEALAIKQLARPTYNQGVVHNLIREGLYPTRTAKDRKSLVDTFVKKHGAIARDGILWELFADLNTQEADEEGRLSEKLNPKYQARECLIDVFGLPATVKSKDRPGAEPLMAVTQAEFVQTLRYDRGEKLDQAIRDLLAKTEDDSLADGCLQRLFGRGYDADIEAYLKRLAKNGDNQDGEYIKKCKTKLGWTRLHAAVELNVPELIEAALKDKVDVNALDREGWTALHHAADAGKAEAVDLILNAKADPNVKDRQGRLAVQLAAHADHSQAVRRLVAGRSETPDLFTAVTVGDVNRLGELLLESRERVKERNGPGYTPLHVAAREGHVVVIRKLLDAGADLNTVDDPDDGRTSAKGRTPLHLAAIAGKANSAKLLLDAGAAINAADKSGNWTPLHHAAWAGDVELVKVLLRYKADPWVRDVRGRSPLAFAKEGKHSMVVKLLEDSR